MNKNKTKNKTFYNQDILNELKAKYGYEIDYIRKSIRGDRAGYMSEQVKKEYFNLLSETKKTIVIKARVILKK